MRMKRLMLAVIGLHVLGCGCKRQDHTVTVEITNVAEPQKIRLVSHQANPFDVSGLSLQITGRLDGSALLFPVNQTTQRVNGDVNLETYQDWSGRDYLLHYVPESVSTGHLTIIYWFH